VRIVAIVGALLAVAGAQASPASRPLVGLKGPEGPLLGIVWNGNAAEIAPLDATTLEPAGTTLPIKDPGAVGYAPDRSKFAIGGAREPVVHFVDVAPLELLRSVRLGRGGSVERIEWLGPGAAVVLYAQPDGTRIAWVDPTTGEVTKRARLGAVPFQAVSGNGRVVFLLPSRKGIGAARLAIVDAVGGVRIVRLPKIRIGSTVPRAGTVFRRIVPGLALDAETAHAYVVGTDGVVADVNLLSRAVSTHSLVRPRSLAARLGAWLVPTAEAKSLAGPSLDAQWLGGGLIAVAGTSYSATIGKDGESQSATPLGLRIVDVRTWTQRTLDAGADGFAIGYGALLAYGVRSELGTTTPSVVSGMGVAAYGPDGGMRFHLLPTVAVGSLEVNGSFAYGWLVGTTDPAWHVVVFDLAAGQVVRELRLVHPTRLLISDSSLF
jgi:hypothetical protein